jgi:hypothetical protein
MRFLPAATLSLVVLASATPVTGAAEPPQITHSAIACVPANGNARITVNVTSSSPIASVRVYFHSVVKTSGDYYLELRKGQAGNYWAVLPYPLPETTQVLYRIVVKDAFGVESETKTFTVPTSSSCVVTLTPDETKYANNLIIGLTNTTQPAVPDGFKCTGVVNKITVAGDLVPNDECRKVLAAAVPLPLVPAAAWIIGGAAVGGTVGAVVATSSDCNCPPVSAARPPSPAVTANRSPSK